MINISTSHFSSEKKLPLIIQPSHKISPDDFKELLHEKNQEFRQYLLKYGALLFRNFPVNNEYDFSAMIKNLKLGAFVDYKGGDSPRNKIIEGVYTSTEAPPWLSIPLHNEMSYLSRYPSHIFFYCDIAPTIRGETPIADARDVVKGICPEIKAKLNEKGVRYSSSYHNGSGIIAKLIKRHRSWMEVFETERQNEVEQICQDLGVDYFWKKNKWLHLTHCCPAFNIHPETHEEVWFNQAHIFKLTPKLIGKWRYHILNLLYCQKHKRLHDVRYGDGTEIPLTELYRIMDKLKEKTVYFRWQKGDVLVLDNMLAMHGRASFEGKRRILTAMTA